MTRGDRSDCGQERCKKEFLTFFNSYTNIRPVSVNVLICNMFLCFIESHCKCEAGFTQEAEAPLNRALFLSPS